MRRLTPRGLGIALFLAIPPGLGAYFAALRTLGARPGDPVAIAVGFVSALAIFLIIVASLVTGTEEGTDGDGPA